MEGIGGSRLSLCITNTYDRQRPAGHLAAWKVWRNVGPISSQNEVFRALVQRAVNEDFDEFAPVGRASANVIDWF